MASISDLFSQYGRPGGPSINPLGGALGQGEPNVPTGTDLMSFLKQAPTGMLGSDILNRPAGQDVQSLIQMIMQAVMGGGGGLPPLDQGQMQEPPPAFAGGAVTPPVGPPPMPPPAQSARRPAPPRKPRPERPDESRAGKMGITTQRGKAKKNPPKGRSSYKERFASDIED